MNDLQCWNCGNPIHKNPMISSKEGQTICEECYYKIENGEDVE